MSSFRACGWVDVGGVKGCVNGCTTGVEGCTGVVLSPPITFCWCSRKIEVWSMICWVAERV